MEAEIRHSQNLNLPKYKYVKFQKHTKRAPFQDRITYNHCCRIHISNIGHLVQNRNDLHRNVEKITIRLTEVYFFDSIFFNIIAMLKL